MSYAKELFRHRRLSARRDPMFGANKGTQRALIVGMSFFGLYMCLSGMWFGVYAHMIQKDLPVYEAFNGLIIYMLAGSLLFRLLMPFNPAFDVLPYWILPVPRRLLFRYLVWTSLPSKGLLVWVLFVCSYIGFQMIPLFPWGQCLSFFGCFLVLLVIRHFFFSVLRLLMRYETIYGNIILGAVAIGLFVSWKFLSLTHLSRLLGAGMMQASPIVWGSLLLLAVLLVMAYTRVLKAFLDEEIQRTGQEQKSRVLTLRVAESYGLFGKLIWFEVMKYVRNKRLMMSFLSPLIMLFMLLFVFKQGGHEARFMVPMFMMMGISSMGQAGRQYIFSGESFYFDGLICKTGVIKNMLYAKYLVDAMVTMLGGLLFLPLVFLHRVSFLEWVAYSVFAVGFHILIPYFLATVNRARIDLMGADMKQTQGIRGSQMFWVMGMNISSIIILVCALIFLPQNIFCVVLMGIGVLGLLLHRIWLGWIYRVFYKKRHRALAGFRGD